MRGGGGRAHAGRKAERSLVGQAPAESNMRLLRITEKEVRDRYHYHKENGKQRPTQDLRRYAANLGSQEQYCPRPYPYLQVVDPVSCRPTRAAEGPQERAVPPKARTSSDV